MRGSPKRHDKKKQKDINAKKEVYRQTELKYIKEINVTDVAFSADHRRNFKPMVVVTLNQLIFSNRLCKLLSTFLLIKTLKKL